MIGITARAALLGLGLLATGQALAASTFHFSFDDGQTANPSLIGFGTLTLATDPGLGTFALDSVGGYSLSFTIDGSTFTQADITTTPSTVLLLITGTTGAEQLKFSNSSGFGDGEEGGSIDLANGGFVLSFEPPGIGGDLDLFAFGDPDNSAALMGHYIATQSAAPEPTSWALMVGGFGLVGGVLRNRRRVRVRYA
jgi:hypothetical protein